MTKKKEDKYLWNERRLLQEKKVFMQMSEICNTLSLHF